MKKIDEQKKKIQGLGLKAIEEYFEVNVSEIDSEIVKILHNKARVAMQFEKEICLSERAVELNYIRIFRLVAEDKKELKALIKRTLPDYLG